MTSSTPREWVTLSPNESVTWTGRPSLYLVRRGIAVATVLLFVGLASLWVLPGDWVWLGLLVVLAAVGVGAYTLVIHRSVEYVITNEKVYRKEGIFHRNLDTIRLDRVQNVSYSQTFSQRIVDCGDMRIDTAGSGDAEIVFESVPNPSRINGLVVDEMAHDRSEPTTV